MHTELGEEHAALAAVSEQVLAKYFKEAHAMRLEKQIDKTNSVLSCHTEEIKTIRSYTTKLQQRISNIEKTTVDCHRVLQTLNKKLINVSLYMGLCAAVHKL